MKHLLLIFSYALVLAFWLNANSFVSQTRTITGNKCYAMLGSSGRGEQCVSTLDGKVCYDVTPRTKQVGFGSDPDHPSFQTGAEYKVTLNNSNATRIVFTGRVEEATQECEPD